MLTSLSFSHVHYVALPSSSGGRDESQKGHGALLLEYSKQKCLINVMSKHIVLRREDSHSYRHCANSESFVVALLSSHVL